MEIDEGLPQEEEEQHSQAVLSMDTSEAAINISVYLRMSPQASARLLRQRAGRAMVSSEVLCTLLQDGGARTQLSPEHSSLLVQALLRLGETNGDEDPDEITVSDTPADSSSDEEEEEEEETEQRAPSQNLMEYVEQSVEGLDGVMMSFFVPAREGLTSAQIKRLPVYRYNARKHKCEQISCSICLNDFKTLQFLRRLPCFHQFHRKCVDPWLADKRKCPTCRIDAKPVDVPAADVEMYMSRSSQSL